MSAINTKSLAYYSTQNLLVPCEGPRSVPLSLDFSTNPTYTINLQNTTALLLVSMVQAMYVDNSNNPAQLVITVPTGNQVIKVAAGWQGYFNLLCPNPPNLAFDSQGGVRVAVNLLNFPVTNHSWPTT